LTRDPAAYLADMLEHAQDYLGLRLSRVFETATIFIPDLIARLPAIILDAEL
jgi:uncharacterized protein with HEPN domain